MLGNEIRLLTRTAAIKLAFLTSSSLLSLVLLEVGLRVIEGGNGRSKHDLPEDRAAEGRDSRTRLQVIDDYAAKGVQAYPPLSREDVLVDGQLVYDLVIEGEPVVPLSGVTRAHTVACNESGTYLEYTSDEYGFHNAEGAHAGPAPLVLIGDSFAAGGCVPTEDNAASALQRTYPGLVNLGRSGNGPLSNLATLKEYGAPLRPPIVVWMHYEGNDMLDLAAESTSDALMQYLQPEHRRELRDHRDALDRTTRAFIAERKARARTTALGTVQSVVTLRYLRGRLFRRSKAKVNVPRNFQLFRQVLREAKRITESWGGRLVFVHLPTAAAIQGSNATKVHRIRLRRTLKNAQIEHVDLTETFARVEDPASLFPLGIIIRHYNARGFALVASQIEAALDGSANDAVTE